MSVFRSSFRALAAGATLAFGATTLHAQAADTSRKDLAATLAAAGNYTTFAKLLDAANLTSTLQGSAEFTVFAPTDEAFAKISAERMKAWQSDTARLKKVLLYHIVSGKISANKILNLKNARTMGGGKVELSVKDARVRVNDSIIIQPDIKASNGLIQGIDSVLMPKDAP